jgi:8-oxo-dGTP diphosphatase
MVYDHTRLNLILTNHHSPCHQCIMNNVEQRPRKLVVAGLIVDDESTHVLITQRRADQSFPLDWEFPGGKMESGESPQQALRRELSEEIAVTVEVGAIWDVLFHRHQGFDVVMLIYQCRICSGQPQRQQVNDLQWLTVAQLPTAGIMEADAALVDRLVVEGIPTWRSVIGPNH